MLFAYMVARIVAVPNSAYPSSNDDPQPVALGKVELPRAVDPDMLDCLRFDRPELASMLRVVRHLQFPQSVI
jgi:hypothetical protein